MTKDNHLLQSRHGACGSEGKFVSMSSLGFRRVAGEGDLTDRFDLFYFVSLYVEIRNLGVLCTKADFLPRNLKVLGSTGRPRESTMDLPEHCEPAC